jgi:hypothetical protein
LVGTLEEQLEQQENARQRQQNKIQEMAKLQDQTRLAEDRQVKLNELLMQFDKLQNENNELKTGLVNACFDLYCLVDETRSYAKKKTILLFHTISARPPTASYGTYLP